MKNIKSITAAFLMVGILSVGTLSANAGIIVGNREGIIVGNKVEKNTKQQPCTSTGKKAGIIVGNLVSTVAGIIVGNFAGIIVGNAVGGGNTNCGIIVGN